MQERARDAGHTFRSLQAIESQVAKLEKKAYAWRLREELAPLGPDITRINAEGARLLQELNTHHVDNPDRKLTYRSIKNSTYATLTLTAESSRVKQIYDRARATDKSCPANGLIRLALAANDGKLPAAATPCLLVPLDMSFTGFIEEERGKFRFSLTNGATMSGEEIVHTQLSNFLLTALVHPYAPQNFGAIVWRGWRRCLIWLLMSHSLDFCTASVGCLWLFFRCVSSARGKQGSGLGVLIP